MTKTEQALNERINKLSKRVAKLQQIVHQREYNESYYAKNRGAAAEKRKAEREKKHDQVLNFLRKFKGLKMESVRNDGDKRYLLLCSNNEAQKLRKLAATDLRGVLSGRKKKS